MNEKPKKCDVCGKPAKYVLRIYVDIKDTSFDENIACVCEQHKKVRQHMFELQKIL